jgi:autotransporter adhesin
MRGYNGSGGSGSAAGSLTLYRMSRAFGWLSIIATVAIVIFLATVAYSASGIRYDGVTPLAGTGVPGNLVDFTVSVKLANPGYYPMQNFNLSLRVVYPQNGLLAIGSSMVNSLGGGSTQQIPVTFPVDLAAPQVRGLLTNDTKLTLAAWANATYGYFFPFHVTISDNISWGAPFYGLAVVAGTPTVGTGGTVVVPITISFSNHSPIPLVGYLGFSVASAAGVTCGSGNLNVTALPTQHYDSTTDVTVADGCNPQGGQVNATYTSALLTATLPPIQIP